jgi:hypothetical protein
MRRLLLVVLLALAFPPLAASDDVIGRDRAVVFGGVQTDGLFTPSQPVVVDAPGVTNGLELWFAPDDRSFAPALIAVDRDGTAQTFGPDCAGACVTHDEYRFDLSSARFPFDEGAGTLVVRSAADGTALGSTHAYWDATPPVATITTPHFDSPFKKNGWEIVAHTLDQNIAKIVVSWGPGVPRRFTPLYEQHTLGYTLGNDGHASCAPTSAMAAMEWLSQPFLFNLVPTSICGSDRVCYVGLMGLAMGTTGSKGTSGAGLENGLNLWLQASGYSGYVDHQVAVMTPQQMVDLANAGGATILGLHNTPADTAMGAKFGHVVVLDNAVPKPDGSAVVTIMDPNQEPNPGGAMVGAYRSFVMHTDGTIDWSSAYTTYYDPPSGKLQFDEYAHVEAFLFSSLFNRAAGLVLAARTPGGTVDGQLQGDGHTWVGRFTPPAGTTGPYLLTTIATDASGHTQRDYQYIGG